MPLPTLSPEPPPEAAPRRKRWTRDERAELEAAGLFENEHLELVGGELISKMGKNRPHVNASMWMLFWLAEIFGKRFVNAEAPVDVHPRDNTFNEPEPDLIVLGRECSSFVTANPKPRDIRLLVEISDTTLKYDLSVKAALYARAGIVEYWVLDVGGRRLISHRNPVGGEYASITEYNEHEFISPLAAPHVQFCAAQALADGK